MQVLMYLPLNVFVCVILPACCARKACIYIKVTQFSCRLFTQASSQNLKPDSFSLL